MSRRNSSTGEGADRCDSTEGPRHDQQSMDGRPSNDQERSAPAPPTAASYEAIFRASAVGLTIRSLEDGRLLDVNPAMAALFGYEVEEFLGLTPEDYVTAEGVEQYPEMLRTAREGRRFTFFVEGIHRDGSKLDLEGYFQPVDLNETKCVLGVVVDVTEQNRLTRELRESERTLRLLFEHAPDAILVQSLDGKVSDANPAAAALFARSAEDLEGRNVLELVAPLGGGFDVASLTKLAQGQLRQFEGECLAADGARIPVGVRARGFEKDGESKVLIHVSDASRMRLLEDQLRQSQKMEAIGRLAGGVAHDFNNLLTAILGYCDLAQAQIEPSHGASSDLAEIARAADLASDLTRQLLDFSRPQKLVPKVSDLNTVVLDVEKLCRRTLGEDIEFQLQLEQRLSLVEIDRRQMGQVLLNLVINARDAMPEGGVLTVKTENLDLLENGAPRSAPVPPGSYVALRVTDTGIGMTEDVRLKVFEPFFSTKRTDKGTGLGLSSAYTFVNQSRGYIWATSEVGVGSTFTVLFPVVGSEVAAASAVREVHGGTNSPRLGSPGRSERRPVRELEGTSSRRGSGPRAKREHPFESAPEHELANFLTAIALTAEQAQKSTTVGSTLHEDLEQIRIASEKAVALHEEIKRARRAESP